MPKSINKINLNIINKIHSSFQRHQQPSPS